MTQGTSIGDASGLHDGEFDVQVIDFLITDGKVAQLLLGFVGTLSMDGLLKDGVCSRPPYRTSMPVSRGRPPRKIEPGPFSISGVEFIAADMPAANRLTIQIMAVIAENEARMISERTIVALAAAKARGVILGNKANLLKVQPIARAVIIKQADQRASNILPILKQIVASGVRSSHIVAEQMNQRGIKTARGGSWHGATILNLIKRMGFNTLNELA